MKVFYECKVPSAIVKYSKRGVSSNMPHLKIAVLCFGTDELQQFVNNKESFLCRCTGVVLRKAMRSRLRPPILFFEISQERAVK